MIYTIQIIALLQGLFLMAVLLKSIKLYRKPAAWLLFGSIASIIFFILGDDDNDFFKINADWFFFDSLLFITFFMLFLKYSDPKIKEFQMSDLWLFLPNLTFTAVELLELWYGEGRTVLEIVELSSQVIVLGYLVYSIYLIWNSALQNWYLYFMVPLFGFTIISLLGEINGWILGKVGVLFLKQGVLNSLYIVFTALLFYAISFKLLVSPNSILLVKSMPKYRTSGLKEEQVPLLYQKMVTYMEVQRPFKVQTFSIGQMSDDLNIPKQYISEILSVHFKTNFQDFVNGYRVEAFIEELQKEKNDHYNLFGIATQVGFNSKSTFNAVFKKAKGTTPLQFKRDILTKNVR